jgi:hypothetical protein
VADLNGTALLATFQARTIGNATCLLLRTAMANMDRVPCDRHQAALRRIGAQTEPLSIADCLLLSNVNSAVSTGFMHRLHQIPTYDWVSPAVAQRCLKVLSELPLELSKCRFELPLRAAGLCGRADIVCEDTLWEIKTTGTLSEEHQLQVALYLHMCYEMELRVSRARLCNVLSGQVLELRVSPQDARHIAHELLMCRTSRRADPGAASVDVDFFQQCREVREQVNKSAGV